MLSFQAPLREVSVFVITHRKKEEIVAMVSAPRVQATTILSLFLHFVGKQLLSSHSKPPIPKHHGSVTPIFLRYSFLQEPPLLTPTITPPHTQKNQLINQENHPSLSHTAPIRKKKRIEMLRCG